ncbi:PD-(D/E)XK endonuclease-like domain-containing protein [Tumidithrix helvetica PCC 7403]|uniref:PD-(D/E)XK nuclease family protein n=1 Tax=Tumidithrix helvetica TaxID=3457545 RepID=UPI003CAF203B
MGFTNKWLPFASYGLMAELIPPVGQESFHCDMQRGYKRARKKELEVSALLAKDTTPQRIGLLAQKGVYEFHQHPEFISQEYEVENLAEILKLDEESYLVEQRVTQILCNYRDNPVLLDKNIIRLSRGDEGVPDGLEINSHNYLFRLFAAIDCIFEDTDGTLCILDFKTGKSNFDFRQAYIYLLAATYLYPDRKTSALFYNLESCKWSDRITASPIHLSALQTELARIAKSHELEKKRYHREPERFAEIFTPNPGFACKYCPFNSICSFSVCEVAA